MDTRYWLVPFSVTVITRPLLLLVVTASSLTDVTPAKIALSFLAGAAARKAWSRWALIVAAAIGACGAAPSSQRACAPAGVAGKVAAAAADGADAGLLAAGEDALPAPEE